MTYPIAFCGLPVSAGQSHLRVAPGVDPGPILAALDGLPRKRRADARAAARKFAAGRLRMLTTSDPDLVDRLVTPDVHRLYEAVVARSETRLELLPAAFFRGVVRALPDGAEMIFALDGDRVVGFSLNLVARTAYGCKAMKFGSGQVARHLFIRGVGFAMRHAVRLAAGQLFPPRPITVPFAG